jgi:hypothetical protein
MALNERRVLDTPDLTTNAGLNRFAWDMRHRGPWHAEEERRFRGGPLAAPGNYTLQLQVDGEVFEQTLELVTDPRVTAQGVTPAQIAAQVELQLAIGEQISEARQLAHALEKEREGLSDDAERAQRIDDALAKLVTAEGTYRQPQLIDQLSYLGYMLRGADQVPGRDAIERFETLAAELGQLRNGLER